MKKDCQVTASSGLNVRSGAGTNYKIVAALPKGQKITCTSEKKVGSAVWYSYGSGKWVCYKASSGETYMKILKDHEASSSTAKPVVTTSYGYSDALDVKVMEMLYNTSRKYDALDVSTRLFGSPHQFLSSADIRVNTKIDLGRKFIENIVAESPIVYFMPGRANFLPNTSKQRKDIFEKFFKKNKPSGSIAQEALEDIIKGTDDERYFDFVNDHTSYMKHVNILCRVAAIYLGIGDWKAPNSETKYRNYNWENYKYFNITSQKDHNNTSVFSKIVNKVTVDVEEILLGRGLHVPFYVEPSTSFSESASNSTRKSLVEGVVEKAEDAAKDVDFFLKAAALDRGNDLIKSTHDTIQKLAEGFKSQDNGFIDRLFKNTSTVIDGGNMIFPEIWGESSYNKSYNISVNLSTPYGDKESIYLNIFVPMFHLLALALPRQIHSNGYTSPMLVKVFSKGWFSCDMGMVDSISIEKGANGGWSVDGLPLNAKVNISVRDLYTELSVPASDKPSAFMNNQSMIDFLAVTCGVDITEPTIIIKLKTMYAIFLNKLFDIPNNWYKDFLEELRTILDPIISI